MKQRYISQLKNKNTSLTKTKLSCNTYQKKKKTEERKENAQEANTVLECVRICQYSATSFLALQITTKLPT